MNARNLQTTREQTMTTRTHTFLWLTLVGAMLIWLPSARAAVSVGDPAPDFSLPSIDGGTVSLQDDAGKVVVLEWINPNCPFSRRHAQEKRMIQLAQHHHEITWLAINSTARSHRDYLSPAEHRAYDESMGIDYPVLYDTDGAVGRAYGAHTTPHMFVIDEHGKVIYAGAIDNDPGGRLPADRRTNYVAAALRAHADGRAPDPAVTRPYGCSVKYGD
jgi:peroxiredoxin